MANENLIDYQNQLKQKNLDDIASYEQTLTSIDQAIVQMGVNVDAYNAQKTEYLGKVTDAQEGNILIDETIAILIQ